MRGNRERCRPRRGWMDGMKGCLSDTGLTIPEAKECIRDSREWRCIVGDDVDDPGLRAGCMKQLKLWMV